MHLADTKVHLVTTPPVFGLLFPVVLFTGLPFRVAGHTFGTGILALIGSMRQAVNV